MASASHSTAKASVRDFVAQGGVVTCLICTNRVTGDICGFCGAKEFKFLSQSELPKMPSTKRAGFLFKEGGGFKTWLERYFILFEDGILSYYTSNKMEVKQLFETRGKLRVRGGKLQDLERGVVPNRDGYLFALTSASKHARTYFLEARTYEEREEWMKAFVAAGAIYVGTRRLDPVLPGSLREGFLTKQGGRIKTWRRRYFVLANGSSGQVELQYYTPEEVAKVPENLLVQAGKRAVGAIGKSSEGKSSGGGAGSEPAESKVTAEGVAAAKPVPKGTITLTKESIIEKDEKKAYTFAVRTSQESRRYLITAYDARERDCWMAALTGAVGQGFRRSIGVPLTTDGFSGSPAPATEAKAAEAAAAVIATEGDHHDTEEAHDPSLAAAAAPAAAAAVVGPDGHVCAHPPAPASASSSSALSVDIHAGAEEGGTPAPAHSQLFSPDGGTYQSPACISKALAAEQSVPYAAVDTPAAFSTADPPFSPLSSPGAQAVYVGYGADLGGKTAPAIHEPHSPTHHCRIPEDHAGH